MKNRFCHSLVLLPTIIVSVAIATIAPTPTAAYYIDTGLSDPCHEKMTAELLLDFFDTYPDIAKDIPLPKTNLWEMYADAIFENFDFHVENPSQKYFIASILIGTRWPDEHGRSVTSLPSLYDTHGDPTDQHEHFLRHIEQDFGTGNTDAIEYAKTFIAQRVSTTLALLTAPPKEQIVPITEYVEYYGQITLRLWGPAFYLGTAMHTLQDSFSHTVRTDDLTQILHVMNFIDAVTDNYDASRDGLAHSYGMDECSEKNTPILLSARAASEELLEIFIRKNDQVFMDVEKDWLGYHQGCNLANRFCNSKWYSHVTSEPTEPIVGCHFMVPHSKQRKSSLLNLFWNNSFFSL